MENAPNLQFSVSEFIALTNQTLEFAYPSVNIEGEVSGFKVNQGKYVFFDVKDEKGSIGCFMMAWQLRMPIEDGMKIVVTGSPKLTQWGKFSVTVRALRLSGEGSLKKSFELLKAKLEGEGLFSPERKRMLPPIPRHIGVISSMQAAGFGDFIKILEDRWGGMHVEVAQVQVQGLGAPDQMIRALKYFNSREEPPEVLVVIRGGGSVDDLSVFNDEKLVREISASRVPTLVGVGHEVDVSLADLVADKRAATPSNAAQILVPDKHEVIRRTRHQVASLLPRIESTIDRQAGEVRTRLIHIIDTIVRRQEQYSDRLSATRKVLAELDPYKVLKRGYALVHGKAAKGEMIQIEKSDIVITAEVRDVSKK